MASKATSTSLSNITGEQGRKMNHKTRPTDAETLAGWVQLNRVISRLESEDLVRLIRLELIGKRRWQIVERLYGRLNTLRSQKQKRQLMQLVAGPNGVDPGVVQDQTTFLEQGDP